jgi:hypothetical protein
MHDRQAKLANIERTYGVKIIPVRISGRRWSHDGPFDCGNVPIDTPYRLQTSSTTGVVIYNWNTLSDKQKVSIETQITKYYSTTNTSGSNT